MSIGDQYRRKTQEWIPRDGDILVTKERFIFYTFGYLHAPERVKAYLKYVPKSIAREFQLDWLPYEWTLGGVSLVRPTKLYSPDNHEKIIDAFRKNHPGYVIYDNRLRKPMLTVPKSSISQIYQPSLVLTELLERRRRGSLDRMEKSALNLITSLSRQTKVSLNHFGVHGSISLGMHNPQSDIDLAIYGAGNFGIVLNHLRGLCGENAGFSLLEENIFDSVRKNRFVWMGKRVVVNAIRNCEEIIEKYGDFNYETTNRHLSFIAEVTEDRESIFRPAIYGLKGFRALDPQSEIERDMIPSQVVSMIGKFRGVASIGQEVKVSGSLERVTETKTQKVHHRIVVGSAEKKPQDEFIWASSRVSP